MFSRTGKEKSKRLAFKIAVEILASLLVAFLLFGCGSGGGGSGGGGDDDDEEPCPATNLDIIVCDPAAGLFTDPLNIDNEFFPLVVGTQWVLEGIEDGELIHVEITVLDETEVVAGITTRVMEEAEWVDGELEEISRNFFAQTDDGTVCYFGEDVEMYEDGVVVSNEGEWRAGVGGNLPGIIMPANPQIGDIFANEAAPGLAEDQAEVIDFGEEVDVPAGIFNDTVTIEECNPLDEFEREIKVFERNLGIVIDEVVELIEVTP